jgi:hypothetical protein
MSQDHFPSVFVSSSLVAATTPTAINTTSTHDSKALSLVVVSSSA